MAIEEQIRANAEFVVEKLHEISDAENLINLSISNCTFFLTRGIRRDSIRHETR